MVFIGRKSLQIVGAKVRAAPRSPSAVLPL
jgi:hypothetical protein